MTESTSPTGTTAPDIEAQVEDAGPCRKKLRVTVPPALVREELDRAFLDVIRNVQVPGFRPGHLPRKVAEMRFGEAVRKEVRGNLLERGFQEAMERHGLTPLGDPDLEDPDAEVASERPFSFEVTVEVRPEVTIPDLGGISVKREKVRVGKEDVESALEDLRLDRAELRPVPDGTVAEKDVVLLDAAVVVDGERVLDADNLQYRHPSEVVAGIAIPGIAREMPGRKEDETFSLPVTLPSNFKVPEHAGKEAELRLTVRGVKRFHLPELDADFARSLDFDSLEELRAEAEKSVARRKEQEAERNLDAAILDAALARSPIELPDGIVKKEIGQVLGRYQAELHLQGAPEEVIEEKLAEFQGKAAESVEREFRVAFLVDEFARKRNLFVTENEVADQVAHMAARYGRTADDMTRHLAERNLLSSIRGRLRERKVLDALRSEVRIEG